MHDDMPLLAELDLSGVTIAAYTYPMGEYSYYYEANIIPGYPQPRNNPDFSLRGKTSLKTIILPSTVTTIKERAFERCFGLTSVIFPSSLISIGSSAFESCTSLISVNLPSSLTSIGDYDFASCSSLISIYIYRNTPIDITPYSLTFDGVDKTACKLYVPYGSSGLYAAANQWKDFTNIVEMPGFMLSETTASVAATQASTATVELSSDVAWAASSDQLWLTISPTSGNGNQTLSFIAEANPLSATRTATVSVSATGVESQTIIITQEAKTTNTAPLADAGTEQSVNEGSTVSLDGSASSDPDSDALTYLWTAPAEITLSSTTDAKPTFTAPEVSTDTEYTFSLVVNDGQADSPQDEVMVTVLQVNKVPTANAGADQSVNHGVTVLLDGSASSDSDGNTLTYLWTAPAGITLSSTTVAQPTFTSPKVVTNTDYTFSLVVNDGTVDSPADEVVVIVLHKDNKAPIANAGNDQTLDEGVLVTLDGSASSDLEGDQITYLWTAPAGVFLSANNVAQPTFWAPTVNTDTPLSFSLVVNDGYQDSKPDLVTINVINKNDPPVVVCNNITVSIDAAGIYTLTKTDLANLANGTTDDRDSFNKLLISASPNNFSCSDVGVPVQTTITVTDLNGASATCKSTITVVDLIGPKFGNGSSKLSVNIAPSQTYILPDLSLQYPATDNCIAVYYTQNPLPGKTYSNSTTDIITLTATDKSGNATQLTIKLTVKTLRIVKSAEIISEVAELENTIMKAYPNPFSDRLYLEVFSPENSDVALELFDAKGSKLRTLNEGNITSGGSLIFEYVPNGIPSQLLMYKLTLNKEVYVGKVIYRK